MKKKILIIQKTISFYNVPVFELLANKYDLTLLHSDNACEEKKYPFKTIFVPCIRIKRNIHKRNIIKIANNFDVVICMFDLSYVYFRLLQRKKRKYRLIYWGIGVCASYTQRFDSNQDIVAKNKKWIDNSDGALFYTEYAKSKYLKLGVDEKKLFVAPNTVAVNRIYPDKKRECFLFVGSLYSAKKVDILIKEFSRAKSFVKNIPHLIIVGDGNQKEMLMSLSKELSLEDDVIFCGSITDENKLENLFRKSILCVSPDQAGLSVLKSMGYGVCFVTSSNAFTGGERLNIQSGVNGILLESFDDLHCVLIDASLNKEKYLDIGNNAYEYYWDCRKIEDMEKGFVEAIEGEQL